MIESIHTSYKAETERAVDRAHHFNRKLSERPDCWLVEARKENISLQWLVNKDNSTICDVAFQGANTRIEAGLFTRFCELLQGMTPQEASDHGPILLEYRLRARLDKRQVPGILTPRNADPAFDLCTSLVRELLAQSNEKSGNKSTANFFDYDCTIAWLQKSETQKLAFLKEVLAAHQNELGMSLEGIELKNIEADCKVCVVFPRTATLKEQQSFLFWGEKLLRDVAEPSIQLYAEEKADANKIRQ